MHDAIKNNSTQVLSLQSTGLDGGLLDWPEDLDVPWVCLCPSPTADPFVQSYVCSLPITLMMTRSVFHRTMSHACDNICIIIIKINGNYVTLIVARYKIVFVK